MSRARLISSVAGIALAGLALSGCTSTGEDCGDNASCAAPEGTPIRFAMDWTPNTNHTGLYVAIEQGLFEKAGLDVELLPYTNTFPDTLIDAGTAEFGVSFQDASTISQAAGADVVSVLAPLQHWATAIAVRADDDQIQSPADLDGRTFAGFGDPGETPLLSTVIKNDGGTGEFESVILGTSAYEALYSGAADFTIPFLAWEGIEAEHSGEPLKYFHYTDYGFPDAYAVVIDGNRGWITEHPDEAKAFVGALQTGYQYAADNPEAAAQILIDANPGAFEDEDLVIESQQLLADEYMKDADGTVGTITLEQWSGYASFLFDNGLLAGPDGEVLTDEPDWSTYFTTDYLR